MNCEQCRELASAQADGELWPEQADLVADHQRTCGSCRSWQASLERTGRLLRVRPVEQVPDLSAAIVAAVTTEQPRRRIWWRRWVFALTPRPIFWRGLLAVLALAQVTVGLTEMLGVVHGLHVPDGSGQHLFNESSAWNLALGVGFAVVAGWPRLAGGLLPTLGVFVSVLLVMSIGDLTGGEVGPSRLATHAVVLAGVLVMAIVHRDHRDPGRPATAADDDALYGFGAAAGVHHRSADGAAHRRGRGLRPVGRHVA